MTDKAAETLVGYEDGVWEVLHFRHYGDYNYVGADPQIGVYSAWDLLWISGSKPADGIVYKTVRETNSGDDPVELTPLEVIAWSARV